MQCSKTQLGENLSELRRLGLIKEVGFNGRERLMVAVCPDVGTAKAGRQTTGKPVGSGPENRDAGWQKTGSLKGSSNIQENKAERKAETTPLPPKGAVSGSDSASPSFVGKPDSAGIEKEIVEVWNSFPKLRQVQKMNQGRKRALKTRLADDYWRDHWREAIPLAAASSFCTGGGAQGWVADIDWFLRPEKVLKLMEGAYRSTPQAAQAKEGLPAGMTTAERIALEKQRDRVAKKVKELEDKTFYPEDRTAELIAQLDAERQRLKELDAKLDQ
jgi:hypothetical protein